MISRTLLSLTLIGALAGCADDAATEDDTDDGSDWAEVGGGKGDGVRAASPPLPVTAPGQDPPPRYPVGRAHSPITASVARNLAAIAARGAMRDDVFAKVGDSITVATSFLNCFAGSAVDLGAHASLRASLEWFKAGDAAGTSPFKRQSLSAKGGWSTFNVLARTPALLTQEVNAIHPRYAVVMFGTNDAASRSITYFGPALMEIVDRLIDRGVIPILSTVPPNLQHGKHAWVNAEIPDFNATIRGLAQARQIPLMDFWQELQTLPHFGISTDNVHPSAFSGGSCKLTAPGLDFGYNVRNLLALEALDRARRALAGEAPPDPPAAAPAVAGAGSAADPFLVGDERGLPFTDMRDTAASPNHLIDRYTGCQAPQDESGGEYVYKLVVTTETVVHAMVFSRPGIDVDLHLLSGTGPESCIMRHNNELTASLAPGTYSFVADTYSGGGVPKAGQYLFVLTRR